VAFALHALERMEIGGCALLTVIVGAAVRWKRCHRWRKRALRQLLLAGGSREEFMRVCRLADDLERVAPNDARAFRSGELVGHYVDAVLIEQRLDDQLSRAMRARTASRPRSVAELERMRRALSEATQARLAVEELLLLYLGRATLPDVDALLSSDEIGRRLMMQM
jgi:hypothetical protein